MLFVPLLFSGGNSVTLDAVVGRRWSRDIGSRMQWRPTGPIDILGTGCVLSTLPNSVSVQKTALWCYVTCSKSLSQHVSFACYIWHVSEWAYFLTLQYFKSTSLTPAGFRSEISVGPV